ncbi:MAG: fatty acid desaturase family protein [Leptolyngbya sp. SIO1E4]|nr:fatty acid desaturase family protein [Leptolyngbya sp. SIO1E4]
MTSLKESAIDPRQILPIEDLKRLNERSNLKGGLQLLGHLAVMAGSGYLWATQRGQWAIALPALIIYGFSLASMFAAVHECVHRTAFASNRLNAGVGWVAGVLSFYNSTFYRRYHKWHHRYTQIPGKDPELEEPKPTTFQEYLWRVSGLPWWWGKVKGHWRVATGNMAEMPYIPEAAYGEVRRSTWLQLGVYAIAIGLSVVAHQPWFLLYWLLPLAVGQPILRLILLAEHTGCSHEDNPLTNTRTTLTTWPIKLLMWNMPFHAEHHLYPSIPFHQLAAAHGQLASKFAYVASGYVQVNRSIIANLGQAAP